MVKRLKSDSVRIMFQGSGTVPDLTDASMREVLTSEDMSSSVSVPSSSSMAADSSMFCCPAGRLLAADSETVIIRQFIALVAGMAPSVSVN